MGSLEPQALLACLLLESTPTGRLFCLAADLSNFTAEGTVLFFWIRRSLEKKLSPQGTSGTSSSIRAFAPREHTVATLWPSRLRVGWRLRHTWRSCPIQPSRLRLFSPPPKKLHAPQAQDVATFGMFPRLKRLAQSDSSRVWRTANTCRNITPTTCHIEEINLPGCLKIESTVWKL